MRTMEEQVVYEKKKHVALSNMGRRGGKRSVVHKMMDGTFVGHMARMTMSSRAKRAQQKRKKEETELFILKRNYRCSRPVPISVFSDQHRTKSTTRSRTSCGTHTLVRAPQDFFLRRCARPSIRPAPRP